MEVVNEVSLKFRLLAEEYFNGRLREYPVRATYRNRHEFDHNLEEFTMEAFDRRKVFVRRSFVILDILISGIFIRTHILARKTIHIQCIL